MEKVIHSLAQANDDQRCMAKIAQGDRSAFSALYDRLAPPLYSLALKILADKDEAQDVLQEVFLSVWSKASAYRGERGTVFSWLVVQVRNRAIDRLRSKRRQGELRETFSLELEPTGSAVTTSAQQAESGERAREVRSAMGQISEDERQVLRLAFFEGLTQVEIAEKLEEPLGTIKARAYRGLARLRSILRYAHE